MSLIIKCVKRIIRRVVISSIPNIHYLENASDYNLSSWVHKSEISQYAKLYPIYHVSRSKIGDYTYIANNSSISMTEIGKFCSIGPNLLCGWGIHPINGISTAPMFYSSMKQNGMTLSAEDKAEERKPIKIGNDVFIGANVTILDGVTIGDGAVIGAGAVVSKDIPPYAIAVGVPIRILRNRFSDEVKNRLLKLKWWDYNIEELQDVERFFYDVDSFLKKHESR